MNMDSSKRELGETPPKEENEAVGPHSLPPPEGYERSQRRKTRQRQVILEELQAVKSHPTAVELHEIVRQRLPKVSLGTIYRNLDLLARMGLIEKLEHAGGEARFDANTAEHDHLRCVCCGRIDDLMTPPLELVCPEDHDLRGYQVLGRRLEFIGICPRCRQPSAAGHLAENLSENPELTPACSEAAGVRGMGSKTSCAPGSTSTLSGE